MPTNNPSANSTIDYSECLDIIHHMILSYKSTYDIILLGDLNGTLQQPRSYNKHDILLRTFINELQIHVPDGVNPTFFHHSGSSSSQIDYILSTDENAIAQYAIHDQCITNLSSHVAVSATLNVSTDSNTKSKRKDKPARKHQWEKMNTEVFTTILQNEIQTTETQQNTTVNEDIAALITAIQKATEQAVPSRLVKLKGPSWKASPKVKNLLLNAREKYQIWKNNEKPDGQLKEGKIQAQRELRKQMRKKKFMDRQNLYYKLMENPSTELFYRLIRRNRGYCNTVTTCIKTDEQEYFIPEEQRHCFLKCFEDLSVPKDKGYDSE